LFAFAGSAGIAATDDVEDEWLWLEEVENKKALAWVEGHNRESTSAIESVPEFDEIRATNLEIYNSEERIPYVSMRGEYLYNFWQDGEHARGIWRRTTLAEYRKDDPRWETVLDLDALNEAEGENWVWKGASCLPPEDRQCIVHLSRGGADATVPREFDTASKQFVEGGFQLPEAKSQISWKDAGTVWVGTDFGEGSLTTAGYPRLAKEWKRGTPLDSARTVYEGSATDTSASVFSDHTPEGRYDLVYRALDLFHSEIFLLLDGRQVKLDLPADCTFRGFFKDQLLVGLRSEWNVGQTTYPADALLAIDLDDFLGGSREFERLFEPTERISLGSVASTKNHVLLSTLDNVRGKLYRLAFTEGRWSREEVPLPGIGTVSVSATSDESDVWFLSYTDFLEPSGLYLVDGGKPVRVKALPEFFDADGMRVTQHEATSKDGTRIPYFQVTPKGFDADGENPTLLNGYGGFQVARKPYYSATIGTAWLERGGVFVLANIRGGGEFGPGWHQAALKSLRHKSYEDFIAVAEDLVARKVSSPEHLGIMGGSQGGLLVGQAVTHRPDLFGAVVCTVPLLDMRRYHKLLAGASWMSEYGDPDNPDEWAFIKTWSPYHNLDPEADYPRVFFYTNTRDDRVHPGHARKMVARMTAMDKPVYYYENTEGGHAAGADNEQRAYMWALTYGYLWKMLR
jgi:prolyl oligopeptidase